jgi:hypothetical protein
MNTDSTRSHFVYRAYDDAGRLLYVGCTGRLHSRHLAHRRESDWYPFAARFHTTGPFAREVALEKEREAIEAEAPAFNALPAQIGQAARWNAAETKAFRLLRRRAEERIGRPLTIDDVGPLQELAAAQANATVGPRVGRVDRLARYLAQRERGRAA